ncbi:hypothetical protein JTB14_019538 [Gonioctena quinquepunctata]|nr:hypothetical protein JTB14_019538 [Gonioctena quinquepunctata]
MSVEREDKFGIVQFHGENFSTWKFRVEVILQEYGVFDCLTKDPPADGAARKNFDQQDSHLEYVREDTSDSTNSSTQVSHSSETNGSTFEEEEGTDTETEGVENVSPVTDEVNANRDRNQEERCSSRSHQPPLWLNDYEVNNVAESSNNTFSIAYSTEPFVNNLPTSIDDVESHRDRKQWEAAMMEELKSSEKNRTWTLVPSVVYLTQYTK